MRRLSAVAAFFASLLGFGYIYVGRIRFAIAVLLASLALYMVWSWSRLILDPTYIYVLIAATVSLYLLQIVHPVVIATRAQEAAPKPYNRWWFYSGWVVAGIVLSVVLVQNRGAVFGFETYRIPAASMQPTLVPGDFIMVDAWVYGERLPAIGDVVVFEEAQSGVKYVKRIVGVPGDRIEVRGRELIRNGETLAEPYLAELDSNQGAARNWAPVELEASQYYLLGDNRNNSRDSRFFGPVNLEQIVGRVEYVWFSFSDEPIERQWLVMRTEASDTG